MYVPDSIGIVTSITVLNWPSTSASADTFKPTSYAVFVLLFVTVPLIIRVSPLLGKLPFNCRLGVALMLAVTVVAGGGTCVSVFVAAGVRLLVGGDC